MSVAAARYARTERGSSSRVTPTYGCGEPCLPFEPLLCWPCDASGDTSDLLACKKWCTVPSPPLPSRTLSAGPAGM